MDVEPRISPDRSRLLPGGVGLVVSMALHAAALPPLLGYAWNSIPAEIPSERVIEVSLEWAPPPAGPAPRDTPVAEETRRPAAPATGPSAPPQRHRTPKPALAERADGQLPPQPVATTGTPDPLPAESNAIQLAALPAAPPPPPRAEMLAGYARGLLARLERHKAYPPLSERRGEEGVVTLRLTLAGDGRLVEALPLGEAPRRLVDASLAAVQAASPFPPLPAELGAAEAIFTLPIAYRLR